MKIRPGEASAPDEGFVCHGCGQLHEGLPWSFSAEAPDEYFALPQSERQTRAVLGQDQCIVDDQQFFIRGCLVVPVRNHTEVFRWSVWVSVSQTSFDLIAREWRSFGRETGYPIFGWLCTRLAPYPETRGLKTNVHPRPVGEQPFIELEPTEHPLAIEQRVGISPARANELAATLQHVRD